MIPILAWRNIWRHKSRSLIIVGSVALGMLTGLFILSLYQGMIQSRIRTVIEDEVSHLQIHHPQFKKEYRAYFTIPEAERLDNQLKKIDAISFFSKRLIAQGMLATSAGSSGVEIRGIDPISENQVSRLEKKLIEGKYFEGSRKNELLVGKKLADTKGLTLNGKVVLTMSDKDNTITSGAFRITGIYESTNTALDERIVYTNSDNLAPLLNTGNEVHEVAIVLKDDHDLVYTCHYLENTFPDLLIQTWWQIAPETELLITVFSQYNFIIMIIIMLTLAFGIINTMLMAILERTKETGMMIALGMTRARLSLLVLLETIFLTLIGSPLGIGLAWLVILYFSQKGIDTTAFAESMMGDYGFEKIVYPIFPTGQIGRVLILVASTAVLSSIIPVLRAVKMEPADALRK